MTSAIFQCDGAPVPASFDASSWEVREQISHEGNAPTLNLRIQNLSHGLLSAIASHAADMVRIAAYAYGADQSISRGGPRDVYGKHWRRRFGLAIPVSDPDQWSRGDICSQLVETLAFASDDQWLFSFSQAPPRMQQLRLDLNDKQLLRDPDCVILFSGGADSLCATVEAVLHHGRRPILVSHRPAPHIDARQKALVRELRQRLKQWDFPHISVWIHRKGGDAADTSQRTRSFLFASLGLAIAAQLGLPEVLLPDNGVISLNLPINDQLVGALASRSTHPKLLGHINTLAHKVFTDPPRLVNVLWSRTRPETLQILKDAGLQALLQETNSCSHVRGRPSVQPHCGTCLQCVDRRFATFAAGLEEHDLTERYGTDIFKHALPEGKARTIAESYVRFALKLRNTADSDFFTAYPQLYDCILTDDPHPDKTAEKLVALLQRHASHVIQVTQMQLAAHAPQLVAGSLPETCLVRLVASSQHLTDNRLRVVRALTQAFARGLPPIFQGRFPKNEDEVQRAANGIFHAIQAQLHREVPLLPFAGIATKPDFARHSHETRGWLFIEMKYPATRPRLNGVVTEITSRQMIYSRQGASILFLVYDPRRHIVDDEQFKSDCCGADGVWVEVVR